MTHRALPTRSRPLSRRGRELSLALALGASAVLVHGCSASSAGDLGGSAEISVTLVASDPPSSRDARIPISFDEAKAATFTLDLEMRDGDGSVRAAFTGPKAWVRLTVEPAGQIIQVIGPKGPNDPDVAGPNVRLTDGVLKGIQVKVVGAYGETRIVAHDVGFVPAAPGTLAACANGRDDDENGYADYPNDPNCLFLNDDSEEPVQPSFGSSPLIFYDNPTVHDVQLGTTSPFLARQVDLKTDGGHELVVTFVASDGMYVTDIGDTRGSSSIFVFTFSSPYGVAACDRLTRLSGNVADFFGGVQLGTAGWTIDPWNGTAASGACRIPDFAVIDGDMAKIDAQMEALESAIVAIKNPTIGTHFGKDKVPLVSGLPIPSDGASNCDLNGDGIVGFDRNKGGFSDVERICNDNCTADPDCTEWNNYVGFSQIKIKFEPNDGVLFMIPSAIPGFDVTKYVGPGKLAEVRGVLSHFAGPRPAYRVEPRCMDDIVTVDADPATVKDSKTACVRPRTGQDAEGSH